MEYGAMFWLVSFEGVRVPWSMTERSVNRKMSNSIIFLFLGVLLYLSHNCFYFNRSIFQAYFPFLVNHFFDLLSIFLAFSVVQTFGPVYILFAKKSFFLQEWPKDFTFELFWQNALFGYFFNNFQISLTNVY
jgi:hypothetical protein